MARSQTSDYQRLRVKYGDLVREKQEESKLRHSGDIMAGAISKKLDELLGVLPAEERVV